MTVIFSKKCELALQAVLFLSTRPIGTLFNAGEISDSLKIPKEFVSKVLQQLTKSGIVGSKKGNAGGFYLAKAPEDIRLIQIVESIDGLQMFNSCVLGFPNCSSEHPCPVHKTWGKLRDEAFSMLSTQNLAELRDLAHNKILNL